MREMSHGKASHWCVKRKTCLASCLLPKCLLDNSSVWRYPEVAKTYKIDRV